jgi:5-methyltetrahydrofolate--homocysteine methyltransferase
MLEISGYSVLDLGVDVSAETFIHAAETHGAPIIGLSVFITSARGQLRAVLDLQRNMRPPRPRIIIGGAAVTRGIAADIGADGFAGNAVEAARLVGGLLFRPAAATDKAEG